MKETVFIVLFLLFTFFNCKSLPIGYGATTTSHQVSLGSVGVNSTSLLDSEFNQTAVPNYSEPIKVSVNLVPFSKRSYKAFEKANAVQSAKIKVNYIDSIPQKPNYIKLQIADKVSIINALNSNGNESVKTYLANNKNAKVLTDVSMAFNPKELQSLMGANSVFLVESGVKTYSLKWYDKTGKQQLVPFNNGVVFAYGTSNCCWRVNNRHKFDIVDLVDYGSCPKNTYGSANRAEKTIETIKF
ncbi:hypothetical protein [Flavisericum labens]|uniref:hypothetical protein n=1 Tax=Flavisericum labens TaxID=3377112 RepID=UPI00387AE41C